MFYRYQNFLFQNSLFWILKWNSVQSDNDYEYCNHTIGYQAVYPKVQHLLLDLVTNKGSVLVNIGILAL